MDLIRFILMFSEMGLAFPSLSLVLQILVEMSCIVIFLSLRP
jgi:hypothetical protein